MRKVQLNPFDVTFVVGFFISSLIFVVPCITFSVKILTYILWTLVPF